MVRRIVADRTKVEGVWLTAVAAWRIVHCHRPDIDGERLRYGGSAAIRQNHVKRKASRLGRRTYNFRVNRSHPGAGVNRSQSQSRWQETVDGPGIRLGSASAAEAIRIRFAESHVLGRIRAVQVQQLRRGSNDVQCELLGVAAARLVGNR